MFLMKKLLVKYYSSLYKWFKLQNAHTPKMYKITRAAQLYEVQGLSHDTEIKVYSI